MSLLEKTLDILNNEDYEISSNYGFSCLKKRKIITLKHEATEEYISNLFMRLCHVLNNPVYVHSFYGYVWENDDEYLALNTIEVSYNYEVAELRIFKKLPLGKKLDYNYHFQISEMIKQVLAEHRMICHSSIQYLHKAFRIYASNSDMQCYILLKEKSLNFCCSPRKSSANKTVRCIPTYKVKRKIKLSNLQLIKDNLNSCFNFD